MSASAGKISVNALAVALAAIAGYLVAEQRPETALAICALAICALVTFAYGAASRQVFATTVAAGLFLVVPSWLTIGPEQAAVFRIAAIIAAASVVVGSPIRPAAADWALVALIIGTVLSWLLRDAQPGAAPIVLNTSLPLIMYLAGRRTAVTDIPKVLRWVLVFGTFGAVTVIYEYIGGDVIFSDPNSYSWDGTATTIFRPGGIFGTPPGASTVLAAVALACLPVVVAGNGWRRRCGVAALALIIIACILTYTRASIIGLGVGLVVYLWCIGGLRVRWIVPAVTVAVLIALVLLPKAGQSRFYEEALVRSGNLAARQGYWAEAFPIVTNNPMNTAFGVGAVRTIVAAQGGSVTAELAEAPVLVNAGTHNQYVLVLLEQGVVGVCLLGAWLLSTVVPGLSVSRRRREPITAGLAAAVVSVMVIMLANNALLHAPSLAMLALIAGLLVTLSHDSSTMDA